MKFAKELERDAIPEWRIKYLNYKAGKKYVKAVARAANRANATPRSLGGQSSSYHTARTGRPTPEEIAESEDEESFEDSRPGSANAREGESLTARGDNLQYGSFGTSEQMTQSPDTMQKQDTAKSYFELPAPAINPSSSQIKEPRRHGDSMRKALGRQSAARSFSSSVLQGSTQPPGGGGSGADMMLKRSMSNGPSKLRRLFSHGVGLNSKQDGKVDVGMQDFDLVREREKEFYEFMDSELEKVEKFYKMKENQSGKRLAVLREQLHEMRNRRIQEISESRHEAQEATNGDHHSENGITNGILRPIKDKLFPPGPNSKGFQGMVRTPHLKPHGDASRDYIRRPENGEVSYRTAKRKLKLALQEFYRGLELLKSYALLNRTAFRKLNKKFDKASNARPPYRYMNDKVNKAWFVTSDVLEGHIKAVEDLYARYFERGNHKLAAGKLRSLTKKHATHEGSSFRTGLLLGTGLVFSIQGFIYGVQLLTHDDDELRLHTGYLLQIYGAYFLMLLIFSMFCVNCCIWSKNKINYPFIFEFDQRHSLSWSQLAEFPSFFLLIFGVCLWANFSRFGPEVLYLYYPVILFGLSAVIIFLPAPILAPHSRRWFVYSHWRLLLAGLYPVEFRDFFLGDIYCSLTYAMSNAELFFCLYAKEWENPSRCGSSHSRLMGFLAALPPIWRFLQCVRRYRDTGDIFPHLVNGGKYTMTIMAAVTLSIYRINGTHGNLALFITFALVNSVYCSIWDIFMDFSLLQTDSRHVGLRDIIALKSRWPYYGIMVVDPVIRFAWIIYAIFTHNTQHSTALSFSVSILEVSRRGMWALFRVENEHCSNVSQYKASRDVPLPYRTEPLLESHDTDTGSEPHEDQPSGDEAQETGRTTGSSTGGAGESGTVRRRGDIFSGRAFSKILAEAHMQDFVKRKRQDGQDGQDEDDARHGQLDDDDDDEDDDESSVDDLREANDLRVRGESGDHQF